VVEAEEAVEVAAVEEAGTGVAARAAAAMQGLALPASAPAATAAAARGEPAAGEADITAILDITAIEGHSALMSGMMMTTTTIPITAMRCGNTVTDAITAVVNTFVTITGAIGEAPLSPPEFWQRQYGTV